MHTTKKTVYLISDAGRVEIPHIITVAGLEQAPSQWQAVSGYMQDGALLGNGRYTERNVTLTFDLDSKVAVTEISRVTGKQKVTLEIMENHQSEGRIVRYYLDPCWVSTPLTVIRHGIRWYTCSIQLTAEDPYIKKEVVPQVLSQEDNRKIYRNDNLWYPDDALVLSANRMEVAVYNGGDVDTPMEIRFLGPADQPYIENMDTGEKMGVNRVLEAGEYMDISTAYGKKKITITSLDGAVHNAFHHIQAGCVFFYLHPGANRLRYGSAGNSGAAMAGVQVGYYERYAGYML